MKSGGAQSILFVPTFANWDLGHFDGWEATAKGCGQVRLWCPHGLPVRPHAWRKPNYNAAFKLRVTDLTDQPAFIGLAQTKIVEGVIAFWVKKETMKSMATGTYRYRGKLSVWWRKTF